MTKYNTTISIDCEYCKAKHMEPPDWLLCLTEPFTEKEEAAAMAYFKVYHLRRDHQVEITIAEVLKEMGIDAG
jgi:hypothetical protein